MSGGDGVAAYRSKRSNLVKYLTRGLRPPDPQTPAEGKQGEKQIQRSFCFTYTLTPLPVRSCSIFTAYMPIPNCLSQTAYPKLPIRKAVRNSQYSGRNTC
jgi:hypothetical protein